MARMHTAGIAHNDLHPGNIFVSNKGAQFIDFGTSERGGGSVSAEFVRMMNPPRTGLQQNGGMGYNLRSVDPKGYAVADKRIRQAIGKPIGTLTAADIHKAVTKSPNKELLEQRLQKIIDDYYLGYARRPRSDSLTPATLRLPVRRLDAVVFTDKKLHAAVKAEARRKFKVYPSAYANAWMVQEYKSRGGKFRSDALDTWFKEKWVRMSSTGKILGPCGDRTEGEGKPKCLPSAKALALSPAERRRLVARKRRNDPNKERSGAPVMVSSKTDIWATGFDAEDGKKYTKVVTNPETGRKNRIRYGAKGYKIAPGTDKGDRYCARSFGDMKSHGKDCAGADRNTPLCLSRTKWKCSGKTSRRDEALTPGKCAA